MEVDFIPAGDLPQASDSRFHGEPPPLPPGVLPDLIRQRGPRADQAGTVVPLVAPGLVALDPVTGAAAPGLAGRWTWSADNHALTVTLRAGQRWGDGRLVTATDAAADDTVTRTEVIATGISDAAGLYQTDVAIPRGKTYSVIVIAKGYRPIIADEGIDIPSDATNPYQVDATMRKSK